MKISEMLDSLIQVQWLIARIGIEDPEFSKIVEARNSIYEAIESYVNRLEAKP